MPPGEPANLPPAVADGVETVLGPLTEAIRVGGGCIHPAARLRSRSGEKAFLKWSRDPEPAGFAVEARGLKALADRGGVPVPDVLGVLEGGDGVRGWLLLDWIEPGSATTTTDVDLGRGLAHLHRPLPPGSGWEEDGWIATLPQPNPTGLGWPTFWAEARLAPMWKRARRRQLLPDSFHVPMQSVLEKMDTALDGWSRNGMSLLHGDLWSGNVHVAHDGRAHLVDPAAYRGHREVDLAMADLFGGFRPSFWSSYEEAAPLRQGYFEIRKEVYQLYPLLVHVNLFGSGYVDRTANALHEIARKLGLR